MFKDVPTKFKAAFAAVFLVIIIVIGVNLYAALITSEVTITVQDKESVSKRGSDGTTDHQYRIYTKSGDVYSVGDSLLRLHFNSSNTYAKLQKNKTYRCKAQGFRVPIFSSFKNLIECSPTNVP